MQQVRTVTDKPVTMIINTHTHGDHTGSNEFFPASVEVVAHANAKADMEKMEAFAGAKAQCLPDRTDADSLTIGSGADQIDRRYLGPGHTNGDTIVVFPALKVAHSGDLFAGLGTPLIDTRNGVSYPETLKKAAAGITGVDTVIPGHAEMMPWSSPRCSRPSRTARPPRKPSRGWSCRSSSRTSRPAGDRPTSPPSTAS